MEEVAAKKQKDEFDAKKNKIKEDIKKLGYLSQDEKDGFNKELEAITDVSMAAELEKVLEKANAKNAKNKEAKETEAKQIAATTSGKLTNLKVIRDPKYKGYLYFQLTTDTTTFDKIKNQYFGYRVEVKDTINYYEDYTKGGQTPTIERGRSGNNVTFLTTPFQPLVADGKTYKVTSIWLENNPNKTNLLKDPVEFQ